MSEVAADAAMDAEMDEQMDEMEGQENEGDENGMDEEDEDADENGDKIEYKKRDFIARPWESESLAQTIQEVESFSIKNSR